MVKSPPGCIVSYGRGEDVVTHRTSLWPGRSALRRWPTLRGALRLGCGLLLLCWLLLSQASAEVRVLPPGPAEVHELVGSAWFHQASQPRQPIRRGMKLSDTPWLETAAGARLELRFADGTILRLGENTQVTLFPSDRRLWLSLGKALVVSDHTTGGLSVLSDLVSLLPEGTSYLTEAKAGPDGKTLASVTVTVIEGVVCACPVTNSSPDAQPTRDTLVLPGEQMIVRDPTQRPKPQMIQIKTFVESAPLWIGFASKLPERRWIPINIDNQRRGILEGRNSRLRREIFWKRPAHAPVPPLKKFVEQAAPPRVNYDFPE